MTKQAIIYTRFSPRPNADECTSWEKQDDACTTYCVVKEYAIGSRFHDKAVSGKDLNRPMLQAAIDALSPGDILVVASSDRLARDMLVNLTIRQQIINAGAMLEFADGTPPATSPEGKLFQNILAAFASYERERINARTKAGHQKRRENGERTTGKIPIGWKLDYENPKNLLRHEGERDAILRICELSIKGWSSREIGEQLNREIGHCRGKLWSLRTIRHLIQKHSYWAAPDGDLDLEPSHP